MSDEAVRAQYEAYPYPVRDPADEAKRLITGSPSHIDELNHYVFGGRRDFAKPFRALVAGGGTGDATIMLAQQLADAGCPARGDLCRRIGRVPRRRRSTGAGSRPRQRPLRAPVAARPAGKRPRTVRLHRLLRGAASPGGSRTRAGSTGPGARRRRRDGADALRRARPHRRLPDAGDDAHPGRRRARRRRGSRRPGFC